MVTAIVKHRKSRREDMAQKLIKWCRKNNIIDTTFTDVNGKRWSWNYRDDIINYQLGYEFFRYVEGGYDGYQFFVNDLVQSYQANPNTIIGVTTEGYLNQTLLNNAHPRFKEKFIKFLSKYNYKYITLDNCYYLLYQVPAII